MTGNSLQSISFGLRFGRIVGLVLPLVLVALPLISLIVGLFPLETRWFNDRAQLMFEYLFNTLSSTAVAAAVAIVCGTAAAWLMEFFRLPLRRLWAVLLIMPLAIPPYISAYAWGGFLDIAGPLSRLVAFFGVGEFFHFSLEGPVVLGLNLGFQLFPYVYIMVYHNLQTNLSAPLEAAMSLGRRGVGLLLTPGLALLRPFLAASGALVLMESLNEYGSAQFFGVSGFTTGLFRAWHHAFDIQSAILLGCFLCLIALFFVLIEHAGRSQARFSQSRQSPMRVHQQRDPGKFRSALMALGIITMLVPGLLLPIFQLGYWIIIHRQLDLQTVMQAFAGTALLSSLVSGITVMLSLLSLFLAVGLTSRTEMNRALKPLVLSAYAIPGIVGALAVMHLFSVLQGNLLQTGLHVVLYALVFRFFSISYLGLSNTWEHRVHHYQEVAESLSSSRLKRLFVVYLPLVKPAIVSTLLLTMLDVGKELTVTLLLKPPQFQSLATLVYEQTSQELPHLAALPALVLIAFTSLVCLVLVGQQMRKGNV